MFALCSHWVDDEGGFCGACGAPALYCRRIQSERADPPAFRHLHAWQAKRYAQTTTPGRRIGRYLWHMLLDLDLEAKLRVDLESARERFLKSAAELDLVAVTARGETLRENTSLAVRELRNEQRIAITNSSTRYSVMWTTFWTAK